MSTSGFNKQLDMLEEEEKKRQRIKRRRSRLVGKKTRSIPDEEKLTIEQMLAMGSLKDDKKAPSTPSDVEITEKVLEKYNNKVLKILNRNKSTDMTLKRMRSSFAYLSVSFNILAFLALPMG